MATLCAKMATETNGRELRKLWEEAGILGSRHGDRQTFAIKRWKMYRYHRVAVIGGTFASKFWKSYDCMVKFCVHVSTLIKMSTVFTYSSVYINGVKHACNVRGTSTKNSTLQAATFSLWSATVGGHRTDKVGET